MRDMITLDDIPRLNALHFPHSEALVYGETRLTYADFDQFINDVAAALTARQIGRGDRVAVLAKNSLEYMALYFATARIAAIMVPLNYWHRGVEHDVIIRDSGATILFYESDYSKVLDEAGLPDSVDRVLMSAPRDPSGEWMRFLGARSQAPPADHPSPDSPHMILYTSGTTGRPKGAVLSHRRTVLDALAMSGALGIRQSDTFLNYFPPFHVGNWDHMKMFLLVGGRVVLMQQFDAGTALQLIETERPTVLLGIPTMLHGLLGHPSIAETDLSSVRLLYYGAYDPGGIISRTADLFGAREGRTQMAHSYGLTEAGPFVSVCRPEDLFTHWGSIGRPIPGIEVQLRAPDGRIAEIGSPGELWLRGPMMDGYWNNEAATQDAVVDGWLRTGDMVTRDPDGFMWIVDRIKDVIRTGGQNVYSREVEDCLQQHQAVKDVAVVGVPDDVYEEAVCAVVVVAPGYATDGLDEALRTHVRSALAGYNVPKHVVFVEQLPKNAMGKTMKHVLRWEYGSVFDRPRHAPVSDR